MNKEDKALRRFTENDRYAVSSTHSRRVYTISNLIVLKKSNLRAQVQDSFSCLSFHINLTIHEAREFTEIQVKSNNTIAIDSYIFIVYREQYLNIG